MKLSDLINVMSGTEDVRIIYYYKGKCDELYTTPVQLKYCEHEEIYNNIKHYDINYIWTENNTIKILTIAKENEHEQ